MADRFILTVVNSRIIAPEDFSVQENGSVLMTDNCRRRFLSSWQEKKRKTITHPYLREKIPWGLVPHVQSLLLAAICVEIWRPMRRFYGSDGLMMILITYDVNTESAAGKKRLRQVSKQCVNYGQRVQNSVFECVMDPEKLNQVRNVLLKIIDEKRDSLRFYHLGNHYGSKVEHYGIRPLTIRRECLWSSAKG